MQTSRALDVAMLLHSNPLCTVNISPLESVNSTRRFISSCISYSYFSLPSHTMSTPLSSRCQKALGLAAAAHGTDPGGQSAAYHASLEQFCRQLCASSSNALLRDGPSEALLLASNMQHIKRWERPRSDYPLGLSNYKLWRVSCWLLWRWREGSLIC